MQAHLPILVGGGGERKTLRIVARHADANNLGGGFERVQRKERILLQHCAEVGRDPAEIERTANLGVVVIRDTAEEAKRVLGRAGGAQRRSALVAEPAGRNPGDAWPTELQRFVGIGYRHLIAGFPAPYDRESMERLATEVRPMLDGLTTTRGSRLERDPSSAGTSSTT